MNAVTVDKKSAPDRGYLEAGDRVTVNGLGHQIGILQQENGKLEIYVVNGRFAESGVLPKFVAAEQNTAGVRIIVR